MRSGHHAVMEWIMSHFGPSRLHNDFPIQKPHDYNQDSDGEPCEITNFEDHFVEEALRYAKQLPAYNDATPILVLRDPYNLFASRRRISSETKMDKVGESAKKLWMNHACEFARITKHLTDPILISFNEWFMNEEYRRKLSERLGKPFTDKSKDNIPGFGFGSSFKSSDPATKGSDLKVLERWRDLQCPHYKKTAYDTDVVKMADKLFATTPDLPTHKILYTLNIDNYMPKLCEITIPTIRAYAEKIGARFEVITERKFPDWPITYEKMQLYELAEQSEWTIFVDADTVIGPNMPDYTEKLHYKQIAIHMAYDADKHLPLDHYFIEDRRNVGVVTSFMVTPRKIREIWKPLDKSPAHTMRKIRAMKAKETRLADEYCVSRNMARYGIQFIGVLPHCQDQILHLSATLEDDHTLERAREFVRMTGAAQPQ